MKRYIEFSLGAADADGGTILVEVDAPDTGGGTVRAGLDRSVPERAQLTFDEALRTIRPAAESIIQRLRTLSDPPDQVGVEFGIKLSGSACAIIASARAQANYKVTLGWHRKAPPERSGPPYGGVGRRNPPCTCL